METANQLVTIAAVLLGALTTHVTNHLMEKKRLRYTLLTRWDANTLDAYVEYVSQVRRRIYAAVLLYEVRKETRKEPRTEDELVLDLSHAKSEHELAIERLMLLAGEDVIECVHRVNEVLAEIEWHARGVREGTLLEWRQLHTNVFQELNKFHACAREDLGVNGSFLGEKHASRGLLVPDARRDSTSAN